MYVVNNGFGSPISTTSSPSSSSPSPDTQTITVQNPDGSVTIYTNSPEVIPPPTQWGAIVQEIPGQTANVWSFSDGAATFVGNVTTNTWGTIGQTSQIPGSVDQIADPDNPTPSNLTAPTFDSAMAPVTIVKQSTVNADGQIEVSTLYSDGSELITFQSIPTDSGGGSSGGCPGGCCQYGGCICGE
jgi:hypothetical protein